LAAARILIVDDEALFLSATSRRLSREGYEVLSAHGPLQALEIIRNNPPIDLVVTDINMPQLRGTDLVREIGEISPQTATILMTGGHIDPADVPDGIPLIRKPFQTAELIAAVHRALERSAKMGPKLARNLEISTELPCKSRELISEC
jgi:DNA-binding NtrC family response regulator